MELVPAAVAERMAGLSRAEGLWRGALLGLVVGVAAGAALAVAVIRGAVS